MDKKSKWMSAKNIAFYYGSGQLEELKLFDAVVIEPKAHSKEHIKSFETKGVLTFAYISIVEMRSDYAEFSVMNENDFLQADGKPLKNSLYDTYIMDLGSKRWENVILHKAGRYLSHMGYDGLFLDTIGDVELSVLDSGQSEIQMGHAYNLLCKLKELYPNKLLLQNNGLEKLFDKTYQLIDGICWENPPFQKAQSKLWSDAVMKKLQEITKKKNIRVIFIDENCSSQAEQMNYDRFSLNITRNIAADKGYLYYQGNKHYLGRVCTELLF